MCVFLWKCKYQTPPFLPQLFPLETCSPSSALQAPGPESWDAAFSLCKLLAQLSVSIGFWGLGESTTPPPPLSSDPVLYTLLAVTGPPGHRLPNPPLPLTSCSNPSVRPAFCSVRAGSRLHPHFSGVCFPLCCCYDYSPIGRCALPGWSNLFLALFFPTTWAN